ncbi:uncharacterized protein L203_103983 [Cryptococcus depauperatus CBS 7841]|uniref:Uncharacterized protein n=1 Tax=Cryptococcus depauperatus CBS 7841 TaxID=1295531 RepID=A0A1E3HS51_9TREE|nr:hypothetical protein L203_05985 [Cryptococcus depauperatus CBS 7841]
MSQHLVALPNQECPPLAVWTLPAFTPARQVYPDYNVERTGLIDERTVGRESDPTKMGVWVCLLDEKPHLHPSLLALNKHRFVAHSIPLPPNPAQDLPIKKSQVGSALLLDKVDIENDDEWFTWRFTEEPEARRITSLPRK